MTWVGAAGPGGTGDQDRHIWAVAVCCASSLLAELEAPVLKLCRAMLKEKEKKNQQQSKPGLFSSWV